MEGNVNSFCRFVNTPHDTIPSATSATQQLILHRFLHLCQSLLGLARSPPCHRLFAAIELILFYWDAIVIDLSVCVLARSLAPTLFACSTNTKNDNLITDKTGIRWRTESQCDRTVVSGNRQCIYCSFDPHTRTDWWCK